MGGRCDVADHETAKAQRGHLKLLITSGACLVLGLGVVLAAACSTPAPVRFRPKTRLQLGASVWALAVADVDSDRRSELITLMESASREPTQGVVAVYGVKGARVEKVDDMPVTLTSGPQTNPEPRVTVGNLTGHTDKQILVSKGPLLLFRRGALRQLATAQEILGMFLNGGAFAKQSSIERHYLGENEAEASGTWYIAKTGFVRRDALLVLRDGFKVNGPLVACAMAGSKTLKSVGLVEARVLFGFCFGDVDGDGRAEFVDNDPVDYPQATRVYELYPPAKIKAELDPDLNPQALGNLYGDARNELFVAAKTPSGAAVVEVHDGSVTVRPAEGLGDVFSSRGTFYPAPAMGDIDNDGVNELLLVNPNKPSEIQVFSARR